MRIVLAAALLVVACSREDRRFHDLAPGESPQVPTIGQIQPGPTLVADRQDGPYDNNAWMTAEGQRLYSQMNCAGCHGAGGGGSMGPALTDDVWIYGSDPQQIFSSIAQGRPNGMPAWKYRLTNQQIWQLVSYVRSLSGLTPKGARPSRDDNMSFSQPPSQTPRHSPKMSVP